MVGMLETREAALAQFRANVLYLDDGTGAKARLYAEAAAFLLSLPERGRGAGGGEYEMNHEFIAREKDKVDRFLQSVIGNTAAALPTDFLPRSFSLERIER
jgi:hypothetical protein